MWTGLDGVKRDFYFRQLWDNKGSAIIDGMKPASSPRTPTSAARRWPAGTPAPATPSRSAPTSDQATRIDQALADFAELYADQNELDYAALSTAVNTGRVKAQTGL